MTFELKPGCDFCDKRGLPVLLSRFATAPKSAGAPHAEVFDADNKAFGDIGGGLHYTRRLLRSGYLYMYDEARKRWEGYYVTPSAYLMHFDVSQPMPSAYHGDPQPCDSTGHREVAGMVTIRDPKNAGTVWFAFSDVEWTPAVLAAHGDAAYRARHMRKVDMRKTLSHTVQPNVYSIKELGNKVAEYAIALGAGTHVFDGMPFVFASHHAKLSATLAAADYLRKDAGIVVTLDDPVGIATELGAWMNIRFNRFTNQPEFRQPLAVSGAIQSLRDSIGHQAQLDELAAAERLQGEMAMQGLGLTESGRRLLEKAEEVSSADLDKVSTHSWNKYLAKYNEPARATFQQRFDTQLGVFDEEQIAPLAIAHAAWMKSSRLGICFECHYDTTNPHSGAAYVETLSMCIGATQDKKACFDVYADWLAGSVSDRRNILLRGLVLNQDTVAAVITKGAANSTDPKSLPWDGMIGSFGKATDTVLLNRPDILGKLMMQILGPLTSMAHQFSERGALPQALVAMGVISKTPVLRIQLTGTLQEFQEHVVRELVRAKGGLSTPHGLKAAVRREMKLLQIRGGNLSGTRSKSFLVLADLDALAGATNQGRQVDRARALSKTLANINDLDVIEMGRWRNVLASGTAVTKTVSPFAFSVLGAVLQLVALNVLGGELDKVNLNGNGQKQALWRYRAGCAALSGTVVETLGNALEKIPATTLRMGRAFVDKLGWLLRTGGKTLGAAGAIIVAICDVGNAWESIQKGQVGLAFAYGISAAIGVGGAWLIFSSAAAASGIGLILVLLAIGISFLIDAIKDNPIQEWLEAGYFNRRTFHTVDEELNKLKAITN